MKKILLSALLIVVVLLSACTNTNNDDKIPKSVLDTIMITYEVGDHSQSVTKNIILTDELLYEDTTILITWESNQPSIIQIDGNNGLVKRPETDTFVELTYHFTYQDEIYQTTYAVKVKAGAISPRDILSQINIVYQDGDYYNRVTKDITLIDEINSAETNIKVSWQSDQTGSINIQGNLGVVTRKEASVMVKLTYTITYEDKDYSDSIFVLVLKLPEEITPNPTENVTYKETFDSLAVEKENGNNSSEYLDYTFIGDTDVSWELIRTRIDLFVHEKDNHAITFKGGNSDGDAFGIQGGMYAEEIEGGLSKLSLDVKVPYETDNHNRLSILVNGVSIYNENLPTGKVVKIEINDLNIIGTYSLAFVASSGHRFSVDNISWTTNYHPKPIEIPDEIKVDFENNRFDFDYEDSEHNLGGITWMLKEVHTAIMHGDNETPKMDPLIHGSVVSRFRGLGGKPEGSTPTAHMYTVNALNIEFISFDAKHFSSYNQDGVLAIYIMNEQDETWVLVKNVDITLDFNNYVVRIDQNNVKIKIEVTNGSINLDNIWIK